MKQKQTAKKLKGEEGFNTYYQNIYGERWITLRESLKKESDYTQWKVEDCEGYFLDSGSVRAAVSLPLKGAKNIVDMCAAPGGKTLVLASNMDDDAQLLTNERSSDRKARLLKVCDNSLPQSIRCRVTVTCKDAAKFCLNNGEVFDAILLDAPCSSERHVFNDKKYLDEWSPSRIKTMAMAQWALLSSAFRILTPGGYLLYSTCALATEENDGVIEKLVKKFDNVKIVETQVSLEYKKFCDVKSLPDVEKTVYGSHVLPDVQNGAGPLYFCLVQKL